MKYDIYFHDDFDGRASAAVMLAFLRSRGDVIEHYTPVNYEIIPEWFKKGFFKKNRLVSGRHNSAIVVDFPYHPEAAFWFDHHPTTFKKESWRKKFRPSRFHHYGPSYKSACHLVYAALKKDFGWKPPKHLEELVKWLDVIDGAQYRSARQTIEMREPALAANNFIEKKSNSLRITARTIAFLSEYSLKEYVKEKEVKDEIATIRRDIKTSLNFYKKNLKMFGNVMFIDLSSAKFEGLTHYAPYYLHPRITYAIRFSPRSGLFHLNVSASPWRRSHNKIHIGELLRRYGGGGHKDVGGVEFDTRKEAEQAVKQIVAFLNRKRS